MRLSSFHIDGFGALADVGESEIAPGLVVVLGPNEAGKSTLFDFVAGVLFGFPSRRDNSRFHAPARGGRHGGRVGFVDEAGGNWVVERHAGAQRGLVVRLPDGSEGDERSLSRALAGASSSLFRAVFAVGLDDLGQMGSLESDEVRELLFAASIFGQRRSATKAMKHLGEARDELGRPRREDATANRLAADLEAIRAELADARQEAARYEGLQQQAELADRHLTTMRAQMKALRDRERELQLLDSCWQHHQRAKVASIELSALAPVGPAIRLLEHGLELRELAEQRSGHLERSDKLEELLRSRASIDASVERRLSRMGPDWTRQRAMETSDPATLAESARAARDRLSTLRTALASAEAVRSQAEELLAAAPAERLTDDVPERPELEQQDEVLTELRARVGEAEVLALEQLAETARTLDLSRLPTPDSFVRPAGLALLVSGLVVCVLGAALLAADEGVLAVMAILVGLGLLAGAGLLLTSERRRAGAVAPGPAGSSTHATSASPGAGGDRAVLLDRTRARVEQLASALDLRVPPSRVDIDKRAATLQRQLERRRQLDDRATARALAQAHVVVAIEGVRQALGALRTEQEVHDAWCEAHGFGASSGPDATLEAVADLAELRERLQDLARIEKAVAEAEPSVASFEHRCRRLFDAIDPTALGGMSRPVRTALHSSTPSDVLSLEATLAELVHRLEEATALDTRRSALEREQAAAESALESALGSGEAGDRLRSKLAIGDVLSWAIERAELEPAIDDLRQAEESTVRRHQSVAEDMRRLATSDRIADLERRQDAVEVELESALRRYLVLGTARALLQRTLARHERERQPAVVASAAAHFERVTAGRYVGLLADVTTDGKRTMRVLSARGEAIEATSLSRGTIEQLYLCLRIGLADSFAERSVSLPIVLDDVLVNFDPDRARAVAAELAESARTHQVVFLTCHPHLADIVLRASMNAGTDAQLIRLGRRGQPDGRIEQLTLAALTALPDLPESAVELDSVALPYSAKARHTIAGPDAVALPEPARVPHAAAGPDAVARLDSARVPRTAAGPDAVARLDSVEVLDSAATLFDYGALPEYAARADNGVDASVGSEGVRRRPVPPAAGESSAG